MTPYLTIAFIAGLMLGAMLGAHYVTTQAIKRQPVAPTKYRRKYRDAPEVTEPVPQCQVARESERGIDYKFMGMTGAEDQ